MSFLHSVASLTPTEPGHVLLLALDHIAGSAAPYHMVVEILTTVSIDTAL